MVLNGFLCLFNIIFHLLEQDRINQDIASLLEQRKMLQKFSKYPILDGPHFQRVCKGGSQYQLGLKIFVTLFFNVNGYYETSSTKNSG